MIATYIAASAAFFTLMAVACLRPPLKDSDATAALLHGCFATAGWITFALTF